MTNDLPKTQDSNWKSQAYLISGVTGLVLGLLSAYLFVRAAQERDDGPQRLKTMDGLSLAVALLSILRQVTDLGANGGSKK